MSILRKLTRRRPPITPFGELDDTVHSPTFFTCQNPDYAGFQIGRYTYGRPTILYEEPGGATLRIGSFCSIARQVTIFLGGEHHLHAATTYPFEFLFKDAKPLDACRRPSRGDVTIGHDVWICHGVTIRSGVTVGNGAVLGAGAMVVKDVPAYAVVGGNPGRIVSYRFEPETIGRLERLAWWDWPEAKIKQAWPSLLSEDLEALFAME